MTSHPDDGVRQELATPGRSQGPFPWHPMLFAAALVIVLYLDTSTSIVGSVRSLLVFIGGALALTVVLGVVARNLRWGALIASICLLLVRRGEVGGEATAIVVSAAGVAAAGLLLRWRRVERPIMVATRALNTVSLALLAVLVANVVIAGRIPGLLADFPHAGSMRDLAMRGADPGLSDPSRPDVYVIMLDGYPRLDTFARLYAFDNSPFVEALEQRGFAVAADSQSNYMYTELSLTSMLNMRQIPDMPFIGNEESLRLLINHNPVFEEFRRRGYVVIADHPGWESETMRSADILCGQEQVSDFELNLVASSLAGRLAELAAPDAVADRDRNSINSALDCISQVAKVSLGQPRFMFAHVPAPHLPIVFRPDGSRAEPRLYGHTRGDVKLPYAAFAKGYTDGIQYLNARVLAAIDRIRAESVTPPVIVVFSDHGSESHLNWGNALLSDMDERFDNFTATMTPGVDDLLGESPTPVNVFPQLFNHYFDTEIPLQPDDQYVSTVQDRLGLQPRH